MTSTAASTGDESACSGPKARRIPASMSAKRSKSRDSLVGK
jgi:hypothetical protein